jgi:hypothetical protein
VLRKPNIRRPMGKVLGADKLSTCTTRATVMTVQQQSRRLNSSLDPNCQHCTGL